MYDSLAVGKVNGCSFFLFYWREMRRFLGKPYGGGLCSLLPVLLETSFIVCLFVLCCCFVFLVRGTKHS